MDATAGIDPSTAAAILAGAPDATIVIDRGGTILYANRQVMDLFGWPPAELVGQQLEVLVPEALRTRHVHERDAFSAAPHARPMGVGLDLSGLRRDGSEVPVEISLSPIETPHGCPRRGQHPRHQRATRRGGGAARRARPRDRGDRGAARWHDRVRRRRRALRRASTAASVSSSASRPRRCWRRHTRPRGGRRTSGSATRPAGRRCSRVRRAASS